MAIQINLDGGLMAYRGQIIQRLLLRKTSITIGQGASEQLKAVVGTVLQRADAKIVLYDKNGDEVTTLYNGSELFAQLTIKPAITDGTAGEDGSGAINSRSWLLDVASFATGKIEVYLKGDLLDDETMLVSQVDTDFWSSRPRGSGSYITTFNFTVTEV